MVLTKPVLSFIPFREKRNSFVERERALVGKVAFFFYDLVSVLAFFFVDETTICCNDPNWFLGCVMFVCRPNAMSILFLLLSLMRSTFSW